MMCIDCLGDCFVAGVGYVIGCVCDCDFVIWIVIRFCLRVFVFCGFYVLMILCFD